MPNVGVSLSPSALRRALDLLEAGQHETLDALVESLILGQQIPVATEAKEPLAKEDGDEPGLAQRPPADAPLELAQETGSPRGQLQFLTNRLNPIKLSTRALANLAIKQGSWPSAPEFQLAAAALARREGQRLRAEDESARRRGSSRRWVAYPVSDEAQPAIDRFVFSFTLSYANGSVIGPLPLLGLVAPVRDRVALTEAGWRLAHALSPILDRVGDGTVSRDEAAIFRSQLRKAPDERAAVAEFLRAVRRAGSIQPSVDHLLGTLHHEWSADQAAAERAAMVGRLAELDALRVIGRGRSAKIELTDSAELEKWEEE